MAFRQFVQPVYRKVSTKNTIRTPKSSPKRTITPKLMSQPINAFNITMNQGIQREKKKLKNEHILQASSGWS